LPGGRRPAALEVDHRPQAIRDLVGRDAPELSQHPHAFLEQTVLRQAVAEHLEAFLGTVAEAGHAAGLPQFS
jgi:hypothetical protein